MAWSRRSCIFGLVLLPMASSTPRCEDLGIGLHDTRSVAEKIRDIESAKSGTQNIIRRGMTAEQNAIAQEYLYEPAKKALGDKAGDLVEKVGEKTFGNEDAAERASHMADSVFQNAEDAVNVSEMANEPPAEANDALGNAIAAKNCAYFPDSCARPDPKPAKDTADKRASDEAKTFSLFCVLPDANYHAIMCAKGRRYRLYCARGVPRPVAGAQGSMSMAVQAEEYACLDRKVIGMTGRWAQFPPHFMPFVSHNGAVDTLIGAAYSSPCRIIQTKQVACSGVGGFLGDMFGR